MLICRVACDSTRVQAIQVVSAILFSPITVPLPRDAKEKAAQTSGGGHSKNLLFHREMVSRVGMQAG